MEQIRGTDATIITLDRLDDDAVAQVCQDLLGGTPDTTVSETVARALGHPFLLVELLHGLEDEGLVELADGTAHITAGRVPRRMLDSVGSQVARLRGDTRAALEMAAVLGRRFSVEELAAVMDRQPVALLDAVREAIGAGLVVEDGERLRFRHDLVRESIDASLPVAMRRAMQRRALDVMLKYGAPPADVARLVIEVAQPGDLQGRRCCAGRRRSLRVPGGRGAAESTCAGTGSIGRRGVRRVVEETVGLLVSEPRVGSDEADRGTDSGQIDPLTEARTRSGLVSLMMQYDAREAVNQCRLSLALPGLPPILRSQMLPFMSSSLELLGETDRAAQAARCSRRTGLPGDSAQLLVTLLPRALIAFTQRDWVQALSLAGAAVSEHLRPEEYASSHLWLYDGWYAVILMAVGRLDEAASIVEAGSRVAIRGGHRGQHEDLVDVAVPPVSVPGATGGGCARRSRCRPADV